MTSTLWWAKAQASIIAQQLAAQRSPASRP